jgi:hypothetical protein
MKKLLFLITTMLTLVACKFVGSSGGGGDYIMVWEIDPSQQVSIQVNSGSANIAPPA